VRAAARGGDGIDGRRGVVRRVAVDGAGAGICARTTPSSFFAGSFLLVHDASTTAAATTQSSAEVADPALLKVDPAAPSQDLRQ